MFGWFKKKPTPRNRQEIKSDQLDADDEWHPVIPREQGFQLAKLTYHCEDGAEPFVDLEFHSREIVRRIRCVGVFGRVEIREDYPECYGIIDISRRQLEDHNILVSGPDEGEELRIDARYLIDLDDPDLTEYP